MRQSVVAARAVGPLVRASKEGDTISADALGIEYAHIYTDQQFSSEHAASVEALKAYEEKVAGRAAVTRVLLIDDYSPAVRLDRFDLRGFLARLEDGGGAPDVIVLESEVARYCGRLLDVVGDNRLRRQLAGYYNSRGEYPCSMLVASWYLLRLGAFGVPVDLEPIKGAAGQLLADRIVTILPRGFVETEERSLRIVRSTPYASLCDRIEHVYFESGEPGYSDWDAFDPDAWLERNYRREILPEDRRIIEFVAGALARLGVEEKSLRHVADVGAGPNLYPGLLLSPFVADDGTLSLIDPSAPNLASLRSALDDLAAGRDTAWGPFEDYLRGLGLGASLGKLASVATVERGDILDLPTGHYDAATSFFVSESITDQPSGFRAAVRGLMRSVKPGGLVITAHMVGSRGYHAGEGTAFPTVTLSADTVEETYREYGDFQVFLAGWDEGRVPRKWFKGRMVAIGRTAAG